MKIKQRIEPGTTILKETPFVYVLSSKVRTEYCDYCFNKLVHFVFNTFINCITHFQLTNNFLLYILNTSAHIINNKTLN